MNQELRFEAGSTAGIRPGVQPTARSFLSGKISTFRLKNLPISVAVFCPNAALSTSAVDVLVYAHGILDVCGAVKNPPEGLITGSAFHLGSSVDASGRALVVVAPLFDWSKPGFHFLGKPAHLNGLIDEVMKQLGQMIGSRPSLSRLILSGHSRGYDFLEPLARAHADAQMKLGALARLSEVWAFDTTYVCDVASWMKWLGSKPALKVSVFYRRNTRPTQKHVGTMKAGDALFAQRAQVPGRLNVTQISAETGESHCQVPTRYLPGLLGGGASSSSTGAPLSTLPDTHLPPPPPPSADSLPTRIVNIANAEVVKWGNGAKTETNPAMRPTLAGYWGAVIKSPAAIQNIIDARNAWSAAFISWVMQQAGAGNAFRSASAHTRYIAAAKKARETGDKTKVWAYRISETVPQVGDLVGKDRKPVGKATCAGTTYDNVARGGISHCDIVISVDLSTRRMTVVGGNVNNSVRERIVQLDTDGRLPAHANGGCKYIAILRLPVTSSSPVSSGSKSSLTPVSKPPDAPGIPSSGSCGDDRCTSNYIRWVQSSLIAKGAKLASTGKLDDPTLSAIRIFKRNAKLKTKEAYIGPDIERALVAAGASQPPALEKLPCGATRPQELMVLLNKHRGDIPIEILMGWIQIESGRQLGSSTSICERGYFQLHPGNSIELKLDHDLVGSDKEYSVRAGIALVNQCRRIVSALKVPKGNDFYWRIVKLCHWVPSGPKLLFASMRKESVEPKDWDAIESFVKQHDASLASLFGGRKPSQGIRNVNAMFQQVRSWRRTLGLPAAQE